MKILVVEDETPLAMMMVALLTRNGHAVEVARNGDSAIELASEQKFDVITLDVDLPDTTGFEICRELKQRHISHRTPIVFVSGRPTIENIQYAFDLGAADFIEKPFDPRDFISRVLSVVEETTVA